MYSCPITVQISSCFLHLLDRVHIFVATNVQLSPLDDCTFFTFYPRVFLLVLWVVWVDESVALQSRRHKFHHSEIKTNKLVYLRNRPVSYEFLNQSWLESSIETKNTSKSHPGSGYNICQVDLKLRPDIIDF